MTVIINIGNLRKTDVGPRNTPTSNVHKQRIRKQRSSEKAIVLYNTCCEIAWCRIVSYRIVSYRIVSYRIVSYRIVSYRIVWHDLI